MAHSSSSLSPTFIEQHKQVINAMIEKYSVGLCGPASGILPDSPGIEPAVVLLTGTTGGLGSFLLSELLKCSVVERVYAFNRPSPKKSIEERQKSAFRDKELPIDLLDSIKLVYVEADASLDKCGLSSAQYEEIRNSITLIIHNAWPVNFTATILSFEDNIRASRNLVDLGLDSPQKDNLRFLFISSVSSGQSWDNSNGLFPEEVNFDPSVAIELGYGESKYVTERIISKSGLHVTSLRIHQIVSGPGGTWSPTDWFPVTVKSSIALGVMFAGVGVYSWLRDEEVASVILETAFAKEAPPPVLHVINPRGVPCTELTSLVRRALIKRKVFQGGEDDLPLVPFKDWLTLVEQRARNATKDDLAKIPAIRLLKFFRMIGRWDQHYNQMMASGVQFDSATMEAMGMPNFSTTKARHISPTLANMKAVGEVEANAWVEYWISKGLFSENSSARSNPARL